MSFAGISLKWAEVEAHKPDVDVMRDKLRYYGIAHLDLSWSNVLWDEQAKQLMIIEFEGVVLPTKNKEFEKANKEKAPTYRTLLK